MTDRDHDIEQQEEDLDASCACEELMEERILIEDELESEPEEEQEDLVSRVKREELELRFARFERNYRSRRIRELTLTPYKKKATRGRPRRISA